ncbi:hypothetical protein Slin15195_G106740 [Septoria linicola]|uniref:Uncharacterized protein n=1 Tax=Septoria linicola TaxID=215465 RepID=A0A9Q9B370_9PEZI|nr:hypothetical protein Slin14017_G069710 [Septoria linicola]USW57355.1 hypothetical protein Slin15195_G106740 [Septoria linicola]
MAKVQYSKVAYSQHRDLGYDGAAMRSDYGVPRRTRKLRYKPAILRLGSLIALLIFTAFLIGILQFALIRLPNRQGRFGLETLTNATTVVEDAIDDIPDLLVRRQTTAVQEDESIPVTETTIIPDPGVSSRPEEDFVQTTETLPAPVPNVPTPIVTPPQPPTDSASPTQYAPVEGFVPPSETRTIASTRLADDYVSTGQVQSVPTAPPGQEPTSVRPSAAPPESYVQSTQTANEAPPSGTWVPGSHYTNLAGSTLWSDGYIDAQATPTAASSTATPSDYVEPKITAESTTGNAAPGSYAPASEKTGVVVVTVWSPTKIFVGTYLAVILAVVYRILISTVQTQLHLIDPFRQLASSNGALGSTAFFSSYHSQTIFGPLVALFRRRYTIFCIGIVFWLSCLMPALASEAVWVDTNWGCSNPKVGTPNPCPPRMTASTLVIRALQGMLGFAAIILLVIIFVLRMGTGLEGDPSSIAAVASLMGHPAVSADMDEMPAGTGTTFNMMKQELAGKKYKLSEWSSPTGQLHHGIVPGGALDDDLIRVPAYQAYQPPSSSSKPATATYQPVNPRSSACEDDMAPYRRDWMDYMLLLLVVGAFAVVLAYYLVGGDNGFNNFFNSNTFGPRFILTGAATVIANIWATAEQNSMVMAPFIRLSQGSATFDTLRFAPTITPLLSTWRALSNRYFFAGVITIMTLLGEVLNIVISGVPFATGQTHGQFLIVAHMSMATLGLMIVAAVAVIVHRRYEPKIAVLPDTLGAKMSYLAGARMLSSFDGIAGGYAENRLRSGHFTFGPMIGKDGRRAWKVDEIGHDPRAY